MSQVKPQHGLRLGAVLSGTCTKAAGEVALDKAALSVLKLKPGGTIELNTLCTRLGLDKDDKFATLVFDMPVKYHATFMAVAWRARARARATAGPPVLVVAASRLHEAAGARPRARCHRVGL